MFKGTLLVIVMALVLAACASTPATTQVQPTAVPPTAVPPTMEPPTAAPPEPTPTTAEATQPPAETAPAQPDPASVSVYKIVPGESQVSYEVGETFFNQNNRFNVAVGVTTQLSGDIQVDTTNPQNSTVGEIQVDISQFKSDSGRRDGALQDRFLQSATYPIATFVPTGIEGLPETYTEGQELTFKVTGDLTVKEVTKPVTFDVTVKLEGGSLVGTATTTILLSEFGVGPIEIAGMLGTEDQAKLTMAFVARP